MTTATRSSLPERPLAVITGASTGIGRELARRAAQEQFDLVIVADEPRIRDTAALCERLGSSVTALEADLSTLPGVDRLYAAIAGRPVDALMANAGRGLGGAFLDQELDDIREVIDTNVVGTLSLVQRVGRDMRARGSGRILITGSIGGSIPGAFHAVYNGTKAFLNSFAFALREELHDSGVTVTLLMPGPTDTPIFERAGMADTAVARGAKDDPADVADEGFEAMLRGAADVTTGWKHKVQSTIANVTPGPLLAKLHRRKAEPESP